MLWQRKFKARFPNYQTALFGSDNLGFDEGVAHYKTSNIDFIEEFANVIL